MVGVNALSDARVEAARVRAGWLARVATGEVTATQVVAAAAREVNKPLRSMRLRTLLACQPGWGDRRAARAVDVLRLHLDARAAAVNSASRAPRNMTVGNLLDGRGERSVAWAIATVQPRTPWPGFPFTGEGTDAA